MKYTTLSIIGLFAFSSTLINCTTSDDDGSTGGTGGTGANGGTAGTGNGGTAGTGNGGTAGTGNGGTGGTGTGGTGAGGTGGGGDACTDGGSEHADCTACQQAEFSAGGCCESEYNACEANSECGALRDCINACAGDSACGQQCVADHQSGGTDLLAVVDCLFGPNDGDVGACGNVCQ